MNEITLTFTLQDVLTFTIIVSIIMVTIFLVIFLKSMIGFFKDSRKLVQEGQEMLDGINEATENVLSSIKKVSTMLNFTKYLKNRKRNG